MSCLFRSPEETRAWAGAWARTLGAGSVVALHGELGAGKTCFVQGMAAGLGLTDPVTSPTFTLLHEYGNPVILIHMDAYRLSGPEEAEDMGFLELLDRGALLAIEWPERVASLLPAETWHLRLSVAENPDHRRLELLPVPVRHGNELADGEAAVPPGNAGNSTGMEGTQASVSETSLRRARARPDLRGGPGRC